jgi:hypothetical protein
VHAVTIPLTVTKRGALAFARKSPSAPIVE